MNSDVAARLIAAGMSQGEAWKKSDLFAKAERELSATGGGEAMCWFVPGRIEVLGKHTDYAGGRSLLCAVERGFCLAVSPRADRLFRIRDAAGGLAAEIPLDAGPEARSGGWELYAVAV